MPLCEHDAKAQARLAAELLRFDELLDEDASIRFDDALLSGSVVISTYMLGRQRRTGCEQELIFGTQRLDYLAAVEVSGFANNP